MTVLHIQKSHTEIRGIGGSDANRLMKGSAQALWEEMTERKEREDLSDILRVQMGTFTEAFNKVWYQKQTGNLLEDSKEGIQTFTGSRTIDGEFGPLSYHSVHPWMVASLDAACVLTDGDVIVFEAKHTNEWLFKMPEKLVASYYPQLQHNMEVTGLRKAHLSIFGGNGLWAFIEVDYDMEYVLKLMEVEEEFWKHVLDDTPPEPVQEIEVDPREGSVRVPVIFDMTTGNRASEWAEQAEIWADKKDEVKAFDTAAKKLKDMMPDDADEAFGSGITIKKNKAGSKTISIPKL